MLAFLLSFWVGFAPQTHTEKQAFTIVISPWKDTLPQGADVWVKVSLTNTSNKVLGDSGSISSRTGLDPNFQFKVRDQTGKLVSKRRFDHPEMDTGNPINRTLQTGESVTQDQRVSALYDISRPGKYTIQVLIPIPGSSGKSFVKSNLITVTLTNQND